MLYGSMLLATKGIVFAFTLFLPLQVFLLPDVLSAERDRLIALTGAIRSERNLPMFAVHAKLNQSAELKSEDMAAYRYFDHVGPDGRNLQYFLSKAGYPFAVAGENLAMGFSAAEEVVEAWKKSPTHYANLIDGEYSDTGIGMIAGEYQGIPTVYIAQHFGKEKKEQVIETAAVTPSAPRELFEVPSQPVAAPQKPIVRSLLAQQAPTKETAVQGVKTSPPPQKEADTAIPRRDETDNDSGLWMTSQKSPDRSPPVSLDEGRSFASWQEIQAEKTFVSFTIVMTGSVQSAAAYVDDVIVPLREIEPQMYSGGAAIAESSDDLFRVITFPTVRVTDTKGTVSFFQIPWETVKIVSPTPIEKYTKSKTLLSGMMNIFAVSKALYAGFFIFFLAALLINIFVNIRIQRPKVIGQTVGLLGLIAVLFLV